MIEFAEKYYDRLVNDSINKWPDKSCFLHHYLRSPCFHKVQHKVTRAPFLTFLTVIALAILWKIKVTQSAEKLQFQI